MRDLALTSSCLPLFIIANKTENNACHWELNPGTTHMGSNNSGTEPCSSDVFKCAKLCINIIMCDSQCDRTSALFPRPWNRSRMSYGVYIFSFTHPDSPYSRVTVRWGITVLHFFFSIIQNLRDLIRPKLLPHQMRAQDDRRDINPEATMENTFLPSDLLSRYDGSISNYKRKCSQYKYKCTICNSIYNNL